MVLGLWFIVYGLITIMIVDADEGAAEGEDLAKGGEDGRVDDSCGWNDEGYYQ